ncbi:MAG: amino acid ABC transporter permease [Candidatus Pararuminococcus gallinarum]|uniref:amino acid ABC transporter permease n=1 Tax=Zongyangia sp. HA2173 TaxID=3133035 RepID=UPI0031617DE4
MDLQYIWTLTQPLLLGAQTTILLFFIVIILAMPLGFVFTGMVRSRFRVLRWIGNAYITLMRGTPLLLQLFFIYFGLPILPVIGEYLKFGRFTAACIGFVLNYAAYFAEIYRGGLLAIDKGQYEACKVLGLSKVQTTMKVIIPQMIRVALPSIANESITLVKDTSLLYAVSVPEVLHYAKLAVSRDMTTIPFILAAIIYLVMVMLLTFFFKKVEKKFSFK